MPGSPPTRIVEPGTRPPPQHPVEFGDAGQAARRPGGVAAQRDEIEAARAPAPPRPGLGAEAFRRRGARHFLDEAVPGAAALAPPGPARRDRAALLAGEAGLRLGHARCLQTRSPGESRDPRFGARSRWRDGPRLAPGHAEFPDIMPPAPASGSGLRRGRGRTGRHRDCRNCRSRRPGRARRCGRSCSIAIRSAILRALVMSWVIDTAVAPRPRTQLDDQVVDHIGHDRVEPGRRLVEKQDFRLGRDRPRQRHALLHAARQLGRPQRRRHRGRARPRQASAARCRAPAAAPCRAPGSARTRHSPRRCSESNSALPWNSMPNLRISRSRAARRSPTVSTPSIRIEPASGRSRPMMHLISTDLPVPEPPMMTRLSPAPQAISTPSSTRLRPNDLRSPDTAIFGAHASLIARKTPASGRS